MAEPLVSVCVVTYNHERFIEEAVRSVLGHGLACAGVVLNDLADADDDIAAATNRDVLGEILDVPILPRLTQKTSAMPAEFGPPGIAAVENAQNVGSAA